MLQIRRNFHKLFIASAAALAMGTTSFSANASSMADLDTDAAQTLRTLYKNNTTAEMMGRQAKANRHAFGQTCIGQIRHRAQRCRV